MSNGETTDRLDEEEEVTDNGFEGVLRRLEKSQFEQSELMSLIVRADALAGDNFTRLLYLRRALIALFGTSIGNNTCVRLEYLNEKEELVILSI